SANLARATARMSSFEVRPVTWTWISPLVRLSISAMRAAMRERSSWERKGVQIRRKNLDQARGCLPAATRASSPRGPAAPREAARIAAARAGAGAEARDRPRRGQDVERQPHEEQQEQAQDEQHPDRVARLRAGLPPDDPIVHPPMESRLVGRPEE